MKKRTKAIKRGIHLGVVLGTVFLVFLFSGQVHKILPEDIAKEWKMIATAEGTPSGGVSGVMSIMIYPYQASPAAAYDDNLTEATAYAQYDTLNNTLTGDVPYSTAFDIVIKARFNTTHAYESSNTTWMLGWVRANATCSDLSFSTANLSMEEQIIDGSGTGNGYNASFMWVHYYLQDNDGGAGTGFTISRGDTVNVTFFKLEAYF